MTSDHLLNTLKMASASLEREWVVTIDTPLGGVDQVLKALGETLPLTQGPYDNCMYVREAGYQRFRALAGSHAGAEGTIQQTSAAQIIFSLPPDTELLSKAFEVIFSVHVNEEPTIRVTESWGSRSHLLDDKDNPNRYWNRADADVLHGVSVSE
ncbi:hypothetical protein [Kiloniella sp.]|uniref:hypothetical protein n=1 Tax=Kiloniella sp. TaxID=1938587 RepID=UPI003B01DED1